MTHATHNGTIVERDGRIRIRLGTGNDEITAPRGITFEQARDIACSRYPSGTPNRKNLIVAVLRANATMV